MDIIGRKSHDIFKNVNLEINTDKIHLYTKYIRHHISLRGAIEHYIKINFMINFRGIYGIDFILAVLKRIEIAREILIMEIE